MWAQLERGLLWNHGLDCSLKAFPPLFFTTYTECLYGRQKHVHVCMEVSQSRLQVAYRTVSAIAFENGVNVLQEAHMEPSNGEFPSR